MISLQRIVDLCIPVAWHEAVAVAQAVTSRAERAALGSDNCFLSTEGTVEVSGVATTPWPGATFGTLQLLLDSSRAPAELLTLLGKAERMSDAELAGSLRFFARPDAVMVMKELATRVTQAERDVAAQRALDKLRAEATAAIDVGSKKNDPAAKRRPSRRAVTFVAIAAGVAGLAAFAVASTGRTALPSAISTETMSASASQAIHDLTTKVDGLVDSGLNALGLAAVASSPANTTPSAPAVTRPRKPTTPSRQSPVIAGSATTKSNAPVVAARSIVASSVVGETSTSGESLVDSNVYTSLDVEVEPPALVRPQLPTPATRRSVNDPTHIEVHVGADGTVDKVRLYPQGSTLNDRMLVSAAKAWVFRPALKEGHPVKYTLLMPLTR